MLGIINIFKCLIFFDVTENFSVRGRAYDPFYTKVNHMMMTIEILMSQHIGNSTILCITIIWYEIIFVCIVRNINTKRVIYIKGVVTLIKFTFKPSFKPLKVKATKNIVFLLIHLQTTFKLASNFKLVYIDI